MSDKPKKLRVDGPNSRQKRPVVLHIRTDIPQNVNHPLANVAPEKRARQRQTVIASILARLAETATDGSVEHR